MLGDQLEIDIQGAMNVGVKACLILSSLTPAYHLQDGDFQPEAVFHSILDFYEHWVQR
jgi:ribonucleotide monophosphatase NagD (HAD superfamily)